MRPLRDVGLWWHSTYTMGKWDTDPWQMWPITVLWVYSVWQLWDGGTTGIQADLNNYETQMLLAFCNLVGASICLYGLHLKAFESALWIELSGYLCLVFVVGLYASQLLASRPNSLGTGLAIAFVLPSFHRGYQVFRYKRAKARKAKISRMVAELSPQAPPV